MPENIQRSTPEIDPTEIKDSRSAIQEKDQAFLTKVMTEGGLADPYDARDITDVVFRVMRDLMTNDTIEHVESELHKPVMETQEKALQMEVADLWKDTNPIVRFLSRIRQPLQGPAPIGIDDNLFITRVANEGGIPPNTSAERVIQAVFMATKDELSDDCIQEIAGWLPGRVCQLWEQA